MIRASLLLTLTLLGLAGLALAAKECMINDSNFPSVNADGSLNGVDDLGAGSLKICLNTRNGKFTVKGTGQTTNNSGATQNYKDSAAVNEFFFFQGTQHSKLKVARTGKARLTMKGVMGI